MNGIVFVFFNSNQLVEIAGTLLHTAIIKAQVISKFDMIVNYYVTEVNTVQECLNRALDGYQSSGVLVGFNGSFLVKKCCS